jgi:hypothetical protein
MALLAKIARLERIEAAAQDHRDVCREPDMGMVEAEESLKVLEAALKEPT